MKNLSNLLTVFLICTPNNPNYTDCIEALSKQNCLFKFKIIKNVAPLSRAFQEMINQCDTKYFIEVDEDMILIPEAIQFLYDSIEKADNKVAIYYCSLHDTHLDMRICGIRIYNNDIVKNYPFNLTHPSCEVEQSNRLTNDGYLVVGSEEKVLGEHSPKWTNKLIFNRYKNTAQKQKLSNTQLGYYNLKEKLSSKLAQDKSNINLFALLGYLSGRYAENTFEEEKNFERKDENFELLTKVFPYEEDRINLNILFLFDVHGWIFDFETRFYEKYSGHNIIRKKFDDISVKDLTDIDIVIIPGSCHYKFLDDKGLIKYMQERDIKIAVQYNSEIELDLPRAIVKADLLVASAEKIYNRLIEKEAENVIFLPHNVDTEYFVDKDQYNFFKIGWVGNPECNVKNYRLLKDIKYPVIIQAKCGKEYFVKDRTLDEMVEFYNNIDILLILSSSEGTPMPLLEAMSCGRFVLSTNTGIAYKVLSPYCIIDLSKNIVEQINQKLDYLKEHPEVIISEGVRNKLFVKKYYSWLANLAKLDRLYDKLYTNKKINIALHEKAKVVQLFRVPCANSGLHLSCLLNKYSREFSSRAILGEFYSQKLGQIPFRKFPYDLYWQESKDKCKDIIRKADIIHIHHGFWESDKEIVDLLRNKKNILTVYDLSLAKQTTFLQNFKNISPILTVANQPAQKEVFKDYSNIFLPLVNCHFEVNIIKNNEVPHIVFAPTNKFPIENISSKGYSEVNAVIEQLKDEGYNFTFDLLEGLPYEENLERKKQADIIIDDVVHPTWHNTSLEAVCFNAVPVTGYSEADFPFVKADVSTLKEVLISLLTNRDKLEQIRSELQIWRKLHYNPFSLLTIYEDFYNDVLTSKNIYSLSANAINKIEQDSVSIFLEALKILGKYTPVCLLESTCLAIVRDGGLTKSQYNFFLGVDNVEKALVELSGKGFEYNNRTLTKGEASIQILAMPRQTKKWQYEGINCLVPCPVVAYLENKFHFNWSEWQRRR